MKNEIQDIIEAANWQELNTGIDTWKHKYLFPFADVSPFKKDITAEVYFSALHTESQTTIHVESVGPAAATMEDFAALADFKYRYPLRFLKKQEWLDDIKRPLQISASDIVKDLRQFSNGFPKERIPHETVAERQAKSNNTKVVRGLQRGEVVSPDVLSVDHGETTKF